MSSDQSVGRTAEQTSGLKGMPRRPQVQVYQGPGDMSQGSGTNGWRENLAVSGQKYDVEERGPYVSSGSRHEQCWVGGPVQAGLPSMRLEGIPIEKHLPWRSVEKCLHMHGLIPNT